MNQWLGLFLVWCLPWSGWSQESEISNFDPELRASANVKISEGEQEVYIPISYQYIPLDGSQLAQDPLLFIQDDLSQGVLVFVDQQPRKVRWRETQESGNYIGNLTWYIKNASGPTNAKDPGAEGLYSYSATLVLRQTDSRENQAEAPSSDDGDVVRIDLIDTAQNGNLMINLQSNVALRGIERLALKVDNRIPFAAPENLRAEGFFRTIKVSWDKPNQIAYTLNGSEESSKEAPPSNVEVFLYENKEGLALSGSVPAGESTTCAVAITGNSCNVECEEGASLTKGGSLSSASTGDGSTTFPDLANNQDYVLVVQYEGGVKQACVTGKAVLDYTLTEILTGEEATKDDPRCFIATAAYGTSMHQDLDKLRKFRDEVLLSSPIGQYLVATYYQYSPPLAQWIENHETARKITRIMLAPVIAAIDVAHISPLALLFVALGVLVLMSYGIFQVVLRFT